jgi:uroporphyrinogen III methyltransferase/synthase
MVNPLDGRTIVVTRAAAQAAEFVNELEKYGAKVIACPTIDIAEPESYERLDEAIDHLYGYDWLIFTSANAIEFFLRRLNHRGVKVEDLDEIKVCAIGQASADKLHDAHVHVDVIPAHAKAEGVFDALSEFAGGAEQLHGLNILLPRAAVGRDYLPKALEDAGARVDVVTAYRTVVPADLDRGRLSAMLAGSADCIAFTSSSTVKNLALLFDTHDLSKILSGVTIACIGDVTAATAAEYGLKVDVVPAVSTTAALAKAIADHYSTNHAREKTAGSTDVLN